jgi:hypothetical protein
VLTFLPSLTFSEDRLCHSANDVELEMTLPNQITRAGPVRVRCFGRIQRCELKEGANGGMAAAIEKYEFLRDKARVSADVWENLSLPEA